MGPLKYYTREQKVRDFHDAMDLPVNTTSTVTQLKLRARLITEEAMEVINAMEQLEMEHERSKPGTSEQWAHLMKELADLQYVLSGTLITFHELFRVDFDTVFNRVHQSNMSKLDDQGKPIRDEGGKVMKGPNYEEANLEDLFK